MYTLCDSCIVSNLRNFASKSYDKKIYARKIIYIVITLTILLVFKNAFLLQVLHAITSFDGSRHQITIMT